MSALQQPPASPTCDVIIVAAGRGQRFSASGDAPKQYAMLGGETVLRRSIHAFLGHNAIRSVLAVIHADDRALFDAATTGLKLRPAVMGGATRQESVRNGLEALAQDSPSWVLIHDAARPSVDKALIDRVMDGLRHAPGVIPALPVADTLKRIDASGVVNATVPRDALMRAQTPQGFHFDKILAAHRAAALALTDDAAVLEHAGGRVLTVAGAEGNFKITTAEDLMRMEQTMLETRTGQGFDVHRFTAGDHVMLCGVRVPHSQTLLGHSDADVALHAATDAILGAIGAGDIGAHFPPSDPAYKNAPSDKFLARAMQLLRARGGALTHLDITIICEKPKVSPHREAMVARVAAIAGVDASRLSVKATTTEGLGFTGRSEGIAAQAVATVRVPAQN
ncbi:MAG: bifunctional 2-C-methyl-D-erythritol 4-phosphate cytidylyltransferase/2-C-methyl-D-erythritol 2,4-cyclodiphosphate synthase [Rhodospirillaceae bacterium]|nr:bifunctional 2-C-methyl-D-erythritol 4-phosphate cytidylyltransferase/2-C-methyl-D-erythritol 2,4-cyclodiphosphate synthase [Rhodospirillaceae bacterium]